MAKKLTQEEVEKRLFKNGFILKDRYINYDYPSLLHCINCDRDYVKSCGTVLSKKSCRYCSGLFSEQEKIAEKFFNNGLILKSVYISTRSEVLVECIKCNKEYHTMNRGNRGCKYCGGTTLLDIEFIKIKCLERGLMFMDTEYKNSKFKHNVQCIKYEHKSKMAMAGILNVNNCCNICSGNKKYAIEEVKSKLKQFKISLINEVYLGKEFKHLARCDDCNHIWPARLGSIWSKKRTGCPSCAKRKNEKITIKNLESLFNTFITEYKIQVTDVNIPRNKIIVDAKIEINDQLVLFEYNGRQHYQPVSFGGNKHIVTAFSEFKDRVLRDEWLRKYCKENNIILIEIDGRVYTGYKIKPYLISELLKHNIVPPAWVIAGLAD